MKDSISERRKEEMRGTRKELMELFFETPTEPTLQNPELKPVPKRKRFNELVKESELSEAGLFKILKELIKTGELVKKDDEDGRPIYVPSEIAQERAMKNIWHLTNELQDLRDGKAFYWHGGDALGKFDFGFSTDVALDNKIPKGQLPTVLKETENYVFGRILENFRKNADSLKHYENGKTILSIEIDWHKFSVSLRKVQIFIEDINSKTPVFSDDRLDLKGDKWLILSRFDFLIRHSLLFGDKTFERKLRAFLKTFSSSYNFYDITAVNPKLFDEFVTLIEKGEIENILKDGNLKKKLMPLTEEVAPKGKEFSLYKDYFDQYIKAARIAKYGNSKFLEKLNQFEALKNEKIRSMSMKLVDKNIKSGDKKWSL